MTNAHDRQTNITTLVINNNTRQLSTLILCSEIPALTYTVFRKINKVLSRFTWCRYLALFAFSLNSAANQRDFLSSLKVSCNYVLVILTGQTSTLSTVASYSIINYQSISFSLRVRHILPCGKYKQKPAYKSQEDTRTISVFRSIQITGCRDNLHSSIHHRKT